MNATATTSPLTTDRRLPALDSLRFAAALAVTLYHYVTCYPVGQDAAQPVLSAVSAVTRYGYLGVDLFFMISGFVILWSSMNRSPLDFVVSRLSRLYPSFWVSLLFAVLCILVLGGFVPQYTPPPLNFATLAANATMLPAPLGAPLIEGVYWTLEIEIRFYGLIFLLLVLGQMSRVEWWLYLWLAISLTGLFVELPWVIRYAALLPYGPFFVAGSLFYLTLARGPSVPRSIGLTVCAAACAYISLRQRSQFISADQASAIVVPTLVLLFFGLFTYLVRARAAPGAARWAYWAGALTYPLYLTHATMGLLIYNLLRPAFGVTAALVGITALSLVVAWAITVTVDMPARKPFANLLYRWARQIGLRKAVAPQSLS